MLAYHCDLLPLSHDVPGYPQDNLYEKRIAFQTYHTHLPLTRVLAICNIGCRLRQQMRKAVVLIEKLSYYTVIEGPHSALSCNLA